MFTFLAFVAAWALACRLFEIPSYLLPTPIEVFQTVVSERSLLATATLVSALEAIAGFLLAAAVALGIGIFVSLQPRTLKPVLGAAIALKSIPVAALAPVFLIWCGYGVQGKILLAAIVAVFPMLIALVEGMAAIPPTDRDLFRTLRASRWQTVVKLSLPRCVPFAVAGLRIAAPMAVLGSLIAEYSGAREGLGVTMMIAAANLNSPLLFGAAILSAFLGIGAFSAIRLLEIPLQNYMESKS
ncbi:MAG TPA: ABC transporter permease [Candidatus Limnocylindrales bacterium]|nr:ABC transporter permease [Candidatus Limnocylindrales bacterium]